MKHHQPEPDLFPVAPSLSPRLLWMQRHGIRTLHDAERVKCWTASRDNHASRHEVYDAPPTERSAATEAEALTLLAAALRLRLWNEGQP